MVEIDNLDFFGYNEDQRKVLSLIKEAKKPRTKTKLCLMAAPAYVADFDYKYFVQLMKNLGFDKVTELTFGAKIVNQQYHKYIKEHYSDYVNGGKKKDKNFRDKFIASVCPASVSLIEHQHPELKKYLLPFVSPMAAMAKVVRKNYPEHTIVFLAPCGAKKVEASKFFEKSGKKLIEACVTFSEMKQIVAKENPSKHHCSPIFDSFNNSYTSIYPLSGGLSATLHYKGILDKKDMVACDGCKNLTSLFSKNPDKVFYDILFCNGGCIGGPGVASRAPISIRKQRVLRYKAHSKKHKTAKKQGTEEYTKGIDFSKHF
jgi:iron only hydrogenase large subunit-like protein